jgi:hypothetical protein
MLTLFDIDISEINTCGIGKELPYVSFPINALLNGDSSSLNIPFILNADFL